MSLPRSGLAVTLALVSATAVVGQDVPPAFANSIDATPAGWMGPVFQLSKDFPPTLPANDQKPWKSYDFKTQPEKYVRAILAYCREGNETSDWAGQNNTVRKWYHAPGLVKGNNGREFIRGLTRERTSPPMDLAPTQTKAWSNFAVGLYNPTAAYTVGRVWQNPIAPNPEGVLFADGAVGFKLLFTTAPVEQVPFLANSLEWLANVNLPGTNARSPQKVRLLQVDVAVRDSRADGTTGWVFGTFMYQNDAPGQSPIDRLVPVGLMWGNDPDLTPAKFAAGERAKESWINPASKSPHTGWLDRLNGPVDNPISSCLSCHGRAGSPQTNDLVFPTGATDDQKMAFFTNVKAADPYTSGVKSFDYSLQLGIGVRNFPATTTPPEGKKDSTQNPPVPPGFDPRGGEVDPHHPTDASGPDPERMGPAMPAENRTPVPASDRSIWWIVGATVLVVVLLALIVIRMKRPPVKPAPPPPASTAL